MAVRSEPEWLSGEADRQRADEVAASVVIPTYNRLEVLPEVLAAAANQRGAPAYEIVVVDDGSDDATVQFLTTQLGRLDRVPECRSLCAVRQSNAGPAAARNRGVELARGDVVAFLGDDTVPSRGWLATHAVGRDHAGTGQGSGDTETAGEVLATIGYTGWHARMRLNPFLDYINEYGLQFGYALIDDADDVPFNFLYTSNLTLPRWALVEEPFDEGFPYAAWEDIEWAYRVRKRWGLRIRYLPRARVAHDHPTTIERFCQRQEKAGYCATVFHAKHPELGDFLGIGPGGPPAPAAAGRQARLERLARALQNLPVRWPELWETVLRDHYIHGLQRGWRERTLHEQPPQRTGSTRDA